MQTILLLTYQLPTSTHYDHYNVVWFVLCANVVVTTTDDINITIEACTHTRARTRKPMTVSLFPVLSVANTYAWAKKKGEVVVI